MATMNTVTPRVFIAATRQNSLADYSAMGVAMVGISIPTVVITAHDEPGSREMCLAAGASAYLRKPLDANELLCAIGRAIGPRSN